MNPDDVFLRRPEPKKSKEPDYSQLGEALVAAPGFFERIMNWWDGLKIKPFAEIHLQKKDPDNPRGVLIGIKGTF